jgi:demethylmenaquinone methyltransferase/2-methoxy-6-polyprenyl-1,4-benzoquinol methylase
VLDQRQYDTESVRTLFDEMASTYGYVNLVSSFGFTARWRDQAVDGLPLKTAECVVDLMSGMGELWRSLSKALPASARVVGVDLSPEMARRSRRKWHFSCEISVADVLAWEAPSEFADVVVSSFGLKTFDREQQRLLAHKVAHLLKAGGSYSFVEISVPPFLPLRSAYTFYLKRMIPLIGRMLLGNPDCYRMLGAYTEAFDNTSHFASCLLETGLEVVLVSHFFGCATGVRGSKPRAVPLSPRLAS